jgi:hypothetical protein
MIKKLLLIMLFPCALSAQSLSPTVIGSAGSSYSNSIGQIDFTVGEVAITTLSNAQNQLGQGFHQVSFGTSGIAEFLSENLSFRAYPNPASQEVFLEFGANTTGAYKVVVSGISGQVLDKYEPVSPGPLQIIEIPVQTYNAGLYFIRVESRDGKQAQTIKIIKTTNQ